MNLRRIKLGKQKCAYCGAVILIKKTSENYAFTPKHKRSKVKTDEKGAAIDE